MLKKTIPMALYITITAFLTNPADLSAFQTLPDLPGWERLYGETKEITSSKGVQGTWQEAGYGRDRQVVRVFLLSGSAFGYPRGKSDEFQSSDGLIGNGSLYKKFDIQGYQAIMEVVPFVGTALSVRLSKDMELVLETEKDISIDMIPMAETITAKLTSE